MEFLPASAFNDPNPWVITIYATGFAVAFVVNLFALYKMATLDYTDDRRRHLDRLSQSK